MRRSRVWSGANGGGVLREAGRLGAGAGVTVIAGAVVRARGGGGGVARDAGTMPGCTVCIDCVVGRAGSDRCAELECVAVGVDEVGLERQRGETGAERRDQDDVHVLVHGVCSRSSPLTTSMTFTRRGDEERASVTVTNPGRELAFFVRLVLGRGEGQEILPVLCDDNYITLLPGESRQIGAVYKIRNRGTSEPVLRLQGANVAPPR